MNAIDFLYNKAIEDPYLKEFCVDLYRDTRPSIAGGPTNGWEDILYDRLKEEFEPKIRETIKTLENSKKFLEADILDQFLEDVDWAELAERVMDVCRA